MMTILDILSTLLPFSANTSGGPKMALSAKAQRMLHQSLGDLDAAKELTAAINSSVASPADAVAAIGTGANVTAIGATSNITAVPGSFADVAAVQTYLAAAGMVPRIESRLDAVEANADLLATAVTAVAAKVDALIAALKASGQMSS